MIPSTRPMQPPQAPPPRAAGRWLPLAALGLLSLAGLAWAWLLADNVRRGDDLVYMEWAQTLPAEPLAALMTLPPFPGFRPLTALAWGLSGTRGGWSAGAVQAVVSGLWLLALGTWTGWAGARGGRVAAAWMMALMLATPWFRDLPTWRSWVTTVGALALSGAALWALDQRRVRVALLCGLAAIGFKESAVPVLAVAAVVVYGRAWLGAAWLVGALPSFWAFAHSGHVAEWAVADMGARAMAYARLVGGSVWLPALSGAVWSPPLAVGGALGVAAPGLVGALALLSGVAFAVRRR